MALVMVSLVRDHGIEYMFAATLLTGVIQFILGKLKVGRLIGFVPHSVVLGFVNSLAILIFLAQLPHFAGESWVMAALVAVTLLVIYGLPKLTKAVPSPLVAIIVTTLLAVAIKADVRTVGDMGVITRQLPMFHLPAVPVSLETLLALLPYALTLSAVGILESLLTASIVDEMTETKGDMDREVRGQGIANLVAGCFGGMAGCAMIGQSVINVKSGGRKRLSTLVAGAFLLFLIMVLGDVVMRIPMAALVGVMIMVSVSTFEWDSMRELHKIPRSCAFTLVATMAIVVLTHNLAIGVLAGIGISAVAFAWKMMALKVEVRLVEEAGEDRKTYHVHGQLFFASISKLVESLDYAGDPDKVVIDLAHAHVWDHSAAVGLGRIQDRYARLQKKASFVGLNEDSLSLVRKMEFDFS